MKYYHTIIALLLVHNAVVLAVGYYFSRIMKISKQDTKAISKVAGSQNYGFGQLIVFSILDGQGGAAMIRAWCGIWHIISGVDLAPLFMYRKTSAAKTTTEIVR